MKSYLSVLCRPGGDLLSQVLRHSTIGAGAFDGRVRDGIGSGRSARATRPAKNGEAKLGFVYLSLGGHSHGPMSGVSQTVSPFGEMNIE